MKVTFDQLENVVNVMFFLLCQCVTCCLAVIRVQLFYHTSLSGKCISLIAHYRCSVYLLLHMPCCNDSNMMSREEIILLLPPPPPQLFYGPFSGTTRVSRCQKRNFWTLWCKGRLTEADTPTIQLGATPSGPTSGQLHHPPFLQAGCPSCRPTNSVQVVRYINIS